MKVKDIMTRKVVEITKGCQITEAAELMRKKDISCLVITCGTSIEGIVTERDVLRKIIAEQKMFGQIQVQDVMNSPVITVEEDADILNAARLMEKKHIRRLVTVKDGKICGIITESDFMRVLKNFKITSIS